MTFWEHVEALRQTLVRALLFIAIGTLLSFFFYKPLIQILLSPLHDQPVYLFSPLEGFTTVLKVAFWSGFLLSSPFWLALLLKFVQPALHTHERRLIYPFLGLSLLFIAIGVLFAYKITLPLVVHFFFHFNEGIGENLWGVGEVLGFTLTLLLAHGLVFELYVGLLFLIRFDLVHVDQMRRARRAVIIVILVIAAIVTPPDLLSQLLLAAPMLALYESAVLYAAIRAKGTLPEGRSS